MRSGEDGSEVDTTSFTNERATQRSNLPRLYRARNRKGDNDRARTAGTITIAACERAREFAPDDPWLKPTLLGAAFDAGKVERARELSEQARTERHGDWELKEILEDLKQLLPAAATASSN